MDVVVEVERAVGVHAVEAVVGHDTIFEAVGEQVCVDEVWFDDTRIAEQRTTRFDPRERHLLKMARVEQNVTEDEVIETDVGEIAVGIDDVLYGMIELDVGVRDIGQCQRPLFEVVAFEQLHVLGKPQR